MKPETLREAREHVVEMGDGKHGIPCWEEDDYSAGFRAGAYAMEEELSEAATVYRSEADAPTAIVEAALRGEARDALWAKESMHDSEPAEAWLDAAVDAVLSTVLGHVRYAKEEFEVVTRREQDETVFHDNSYKAVYRGGKRYRGSHIHLKTGSHVAILEEAGKEGDK